MRLDSVKVAIPSRRLTNEDIVSLLRQHSEETFDGDIDLTLKKIGRLLKYSGAKERYWLGNGETPIGLITKAVLEALEESDCDKTDIELLIYVGVDRRSLKCASSYIVAKYLGMNRVHCFDISDACMSWSRALRLTYNFFQTGDYKRVMIVNGEFNQQEGGPIYPSLFSLCNSEQIEWSFPGYTVGEAATATILSHDSGREWEFHLSSRPDLADLCTVPLPGYERYCLPSDYIGRNGVGRFTSFGGKMHKEGFQEALKVFQQLKVPRKKIKAIFPHSSSKTEWEEGAKILGLEGRMHHIYPDYGNLVSASIPTGMSLAISGGHITRGDRIVGWVGSSGMSFATFSFVY